MEYKTMRMLCLFDLPVELPEERKAYREFRKNLIKEGFIMIQYSVYVRTCPSREYGIRLVNRVKKFAPQKVNIRLITITEKQYDDMKIIVGSKKINEERVGSGRLTIIW